MAGRTCNSAGESAIIKKKGGSDMKRIFAMLLCFVLTAGVFAGCNPGKNGPSVLQSFSQSLTTSGYTFVTTTSPDGTTTVELVPPDATTKPSDGGGASSNQSTTKPTGGGSTASSVQPSTQPGPGNATGQPTSTVTVPQGTTDPPVLKLAEEYLMLTAIGASYNISAGDIPVTAILWFSQNEAVATVKDGIVTAKGMGTTKIVASYKDQTVYCTVTVQLPTTDPTVPPTLKLTPPTLSLTVGQFVQYNTETTGHIPVESITWVSSNPQVASVVNGKVTALKAGSAVITASYQGQTATAHVTVQQPTEPDVELELTHKTLTLLVGNTATIYNGSIPAADITWTTTNSQIVSVSNGRITAHRAGQAVIQASYKGHKAICTVTVQQVTTDPTTVTTTNPTTVTTTASPATHTKLGYAKRYLYNQLSAQEQGWYRAIDTAVNSLQNDVQLSGSFTDPAWYTIYFIYMFDNPEHFYLGAKVAYSSSGRVLFSYSDGTTNSFNGTAVPKITDAMRQNIRVRKAAFDAEVSRIISAIPVNIPDVEKELMIYDRLLIDMHYNQSAVWDSMADPNWTAYGGIINKYGVCEAYAEAFQILCYAVGINCTGVVGTANGGGHKWNAVQLDGEWYQCDVTFDDPVNGKQGVAQFHSYFNITSAKMLTDHAITGSDYPGPNCTATKYSYKKYFG